MIHIFKNLKKFSFMVYLDFYGNDFDWISIGTHHCEKDYAVYVVIFGIGMRMQYRHT